MNVPASQANRELSTLPFDPELTPGARNAVNVCLRIQPSEKVTVITDEATREIAASLVRELEDAGRSLPRLGAGRSGAPAADRSAARDRGRSRDQPGQHLRGAGAGQRTALAHADDRRGEPPQNPPRPHGQHQPSDHAGRHAGRFPQSGSHQHQGCGNGAAARSRCGPRLPPAPI